MTQEEKELLLKDLCGRLPYGVNVLISSSRTTDSIRKKLNANLLFGLQKSVLKIKPYLFPISSITDEQMVELKNLCNMFTPDGDYEPRAYWGIKVIYKHGRDGNYKFDFKTDVIDWFYKNHIDYRGLIPMKLANDATGLNIY